VPRAGIVTVVGRPNAGKSTLLNRIVGEKLSIVSEKPQSTRDRVVGIHTASDVQMIILDTPGLLNPRYELQRAMRSTALRALKDADIVVYLADATERTPPPLVEAAQLDVPPSAPVWTVLNKADLIRPVEREELAAAAPDARFISALSGEGVEKLMSDLGALLPVSPFLYPEDEISTASVRFFVAELVRETALEQLNEEVPYSLACEVEEFRETGTPVYIRTVLYLERESQKRILIGSGGQRIRDIGRAARVKVEAFIGAPVYLDLWVKVIPNWRKSDSAVRRFGYRLHDDPSA
jgi:GTP-binding protein Era